MRQSCRNLVDVRLRLRRVLRRNRRCRFRTRELLARLASQIRLLVAEATVIFFVLLVVGKHSLGRVDGHVSQYLDSLYGSFMPAERVRGKLCEINFASEVRIHISPEQMELRLRDLLAQNLGQEMAELL